MAEQGLPQQKVEKIEKLDRVVSSPAEIVADPAAPDAASASTKVKFEEAVTRADTKWDQIQSQKTLLVATDEASIRRSPIDELRLAERRIEQVKPVTIEQIQQQTQDTRETLSKAVNAVQDAQNKYPDLKLNPAHDALLTDKLIHVDSSLNTALSKIGVEVKAHDIPLSGQKPLVKFLNYLSNSDRQLSSIMGEINGLQATQKANIRPDQLLALQIKLGFVQTQIEFFTNVLNKAVEGTKTIMNVQV